MNNKNTKYLCFLGVVCCIMSVSKISSSCFVPRMCQDPRNSRAYDVGKLKGENIVNNAWNGIDQDCSELRRCDGFRKTVLKSLSLVPLPPGASEYVICHYHGYIQGISERVREIQYLCNHCIMDGEMVGHMAAIFYCEFSIAFRGLDLNDDDIIRSIFYLCNESMVESCESSFETIASNYTNIMGSSCAPCTQDEYLPIYNQVKHSQCVPHPLAAK
jgi:hypothetical protein